MSRRIIAMFAVLAVFAAITAESIAQPQALSKIKACLKYNGQEYRICYAYYVNASIGSLVPYYKFGRSTNPAREFAVSNRLKSRYSDPAFTSIKRRIGNWPFGVTKVSVPRIEFVSVIPDLKSGRAVINTRETWQVASMDGKILYSEKNRAHRIVMRKVQGLLLHKWVVTAGV